MKAVGYIRVSTERQEISPDAQRHMLEQWARMAKAELVAVHQDRVSGALRKLESRLVDGVAQTEIDLRKRPGLLAAMPCIHSRLWYISTRSERIPGQRSRI